MRDTEFDRRFAGTTALVTGASLLVDGGRTAVMQDHTFVDYAESGRSTEGQRESALRPERRGAGSPPGREGH